MCILSYISTVVQKRKVLYCNPTVESQSKKSWTDIQRWIRPKNVEELNRQTLDEQLTTARCDQQLHLNVEGSQKHGYEWIHWIPKK